jgi:hypothetical protein
MPTAADDRLTKRQAKGHDNKTRYANMAHVVSIAAPSTGSNVRGTRNAVAQPVWRHQSLRHVRCGDNTVVRRPQHISAVEITTKAHPAPAATPTAPHGSPAVKARTGIGDRWHFIDGFKQHLRYSCCSFALGCGGCATRPRLIGIVIVEPVARVWESDCGSGQVTIGSI